MTNLELQNLLNEYPDDMPIKIRIEGRIVHDLISDHILHTSETAIFDEDYDEADTNFGVDLGSGQQYILINPIIN